MLIVDFDGLPSWYLDASETGESTKCPWVGVVEGTGSGKNRETVTASLWVFSIYKKIRKFSIGNFRLGKARSICHKSHSREARPLNRPRKAWNW